MACYTHACTTVAYTMWVDVQLLLSMLFTHFVQGNSSYHFTWCPRHLFEMQEQKQLPLFKHTIHVREICLRTVTPMTGCIVQAQVAILTFWTTSRGFRTLCTILQIIFPNTNLRINWHKMSCCLTVYRSSQSHKWIVLSQQFKSWLQDTSSAFPFTLKAHEFWSF